MCGRFGAFSATAGVAERFQAEPSEAAQTYEASWNVAPSLEVRAVLERGTEPRRLTLLKWGLVPHWADDPSIGNRLTNARAETVDRKPAFAAALSRRRCLVPADGFYEWARTDNGTKRGGRQPYWFTRRDGDVVALGGLRETWHDPEGNPLRTVCLMTTAANADLEGIHDRMPVFIDPEHWDRWLDPDVTDPEAVFDLLLPAECRRLDRHPVSPRVNKTDVDGPGLIDLSAPAPPPQELPLG